MFIKWDNPATLLGNMNHTSYRLNGAVLIHKIPQQLTMKHMKHNETLLHVCLFKSSQGKRTFAGFTVKRISSLFIEMRSFRTLSPGRPVISRSATGRPHWVVQCGGTRGAWARAGEKPAKRQWNSLNISHWLVLDWLGKNPGLAASKIKPLGV